MKTYFLVAVVVAGVVEWLKNFLPEKVKTNSGVMAAIAAGLSVVGSIGYQFADKAINGTTLTWTSVIVFTVVVVGLTQTCYNVLVQTFKAIKTKLTEKVVQEPAEIADELADKIITEATK